MGKLKASEVFKTCPALPNQNQQPAEEWREELEKVLPKLSERSWEKIALQISQAEKQGKRAGLEEARKIFMTRFQECVDDRVRLNKIDQAINQLK